MVGGHVLPLQSDTERAESSKQSAGRYNMGASATGSREGRRGSGRIEAKGYNQGQPRIQAGLSKDGGHQASATDLLPKTSPSNATLAGEAPRPEQTCNGRRCSSRG